MTNHTWLFADISAFDCPCPPAHATLVVTSFPTTAKR